MGGDESAYHHQSWTSPTPAHPAAEQTGPKPWLSLKMDHSQGAAQHLVDHRPNSGRWLMVTTDALWGGQLNGVQFDPVRHQCDLAVATTVSGQSSSFVVTCRGISELRFHNSIPEPWMYAEITEVHLTVDEAAGEQLLDVMLWSDDAGLTIRCRSVDIHMADR